MVVKDSRVKPGNDRLLLVLLLLSLLFTSCLAETLNKKFGYQAPVTIRYSTEYDTAPKEIKITAGQPLTNDDLPALSEEGYIFDGWYSDKQYTTKVQAGTVIEEDTTLYAKWIPKTDIPFTIYNYFLDPRSSDGTIFVKRPEFTQNLTGTTNQIIDQGSYSLFNSPLNTADLDKYRFIYLWYDNNFNNTRIKPDGSTTVNNYYYLSRIYDYEFASIIQALPDTSWTYMFDFIETNFVDEFIFSSIANAIKNSQSVRETYYDNYRKTTRNRYNKHYGLVLTSLNIETIGLNAFRNVNALNQVSLPQKCTKISQGAFYNCEDLDSVYTDNTDSSKSWKTYDNSGNIINLGQNPNPSSLADRLRTSQNEIWLE